MTLSSEKKSFFNFFPAPNYLLLSTSGIAISDDSIKFVQFRRGIFGESIKLANMAKVNTPEHAVEAGFVYDTAKLSAVLHELATRYHLHYVRATLPDEKAYLFTAMIDRVPYKGLRDAVAFIIEENVPISLEESVFDFDIIEDIPTSGQIKVTVAVLPKKAVETYIQVFETAGIIPVSFDIESQAIARAIVPRSDKQTQLIINLNGNKTGFYILEDQVVQFSTTLPYGSAEPEPSPHINELKVEIKKIFSFWSAKESKNGSPARPIEKVLLCGLGVRQERFLQELMRECSVPWSLANPWINTPIVSKDLPKEAREESLDYVSAIGLALTKKLHNV